MREIIEELQNIKALHTDLVLWGAIMPISYCSFVLALSRSASELGSLGCAMRLLLTLASIVLLAACGLDETVHRSDKPLSREEASKRIDFAFPKSAKDIYYLYHAGGMQQYQLFVRFSVPPAELDSTVDALIAAHRPGELSSATDSTVYTRPFLPMPWWPTNLKNHGYSILGGRPFYLWTDPDNHLIFVLETD